MKWIKKGRIFTVDGDGGWMQSHAQIPSAVVLEDRIRIYFATRPTPGFSLTTFLDVALDDPSRVLYVHDRPILEPGKAGLFDEHGIMPQSVVARDGEVWLYYSGWSRRTSIPYSNWTGLAVSSDGGVTFRKAFPGPIVDRTPDEVYSATGCCVQRFDGRWHMWYASGVDWLDVDGKLEEYYLIKYAHSDDGIRWERENRVLLTPNAPVEPTHRPSVIAIGGAYHMWFCYRGIEDFRDGAGSYRIGYARSSDLRTWERDDTQAGLAPSSDGWDARMQAYPNIVAAGGTHYLFYNGNGFGVSGFGYAELER